MREQIRPNLRMWVLRRDKFTCRYCGRTRQDGAKLQVDHVHSVHNGGNNHHSNLVTACWECNIGKGRRSMSQEEVPAVAVEKPPEETGGNEEYEPPDLSPAMAACTGAAMAREFRIALMNDHHTFVLRYQDFKSDLPGTTPAISEEINNRYQSLLDAICVFSDECIKKVDEVVAKENQRVNEYWEGQG